MFWLRRCAVTITSLTPVDCAGGVGGVSAWASGAMASSAPRLMAPSRAGLVKRRVVSGITGVPQVELSSPAAPADLALALVWGRRVRTAADHDKRKTTLTARGLRYVSGLRHKCRAVGSSGARTLPPRNLASLTPAV